MKFSDMNDINYKKFKEYEHITTEALWVTKGSKHHIISNTIEKSMKNYHGLFIPEIPYQMMLRYTKEGEYVWDCFAGSGTTIDVGKILGRNVIANDLKSLRDDIIQADSRVFNPNENVQMIIMHPPYHNIIEFSNEPNDLSQCKDYKLFLNEFEAVVDNVIQYLDKERILILVMGEIYTNSEEIPLGFYGMEIIKKKGFKLKGWIVKDYGETKGGVLKAEDFQLHRYRALKGGYWNFAGDNIFILQKKR